MLIGEIVQIDVETLNIGQEEKLRQVIKKEGVLISEEVIQKAEMVEISNPAEVIREREGSNSTRGLLSECLFRSMWQRVLRYFGWML